MKHPPPPPPGLPTPPPPPRGKKIWEGVEELNKGRRKTESVGGLVAWAINIEGMARNFKILTQWVAEEKPHAIMLSETWVLQQEMGVYNIPGYDRSGAPAKKDKKKGRPSGGMMEYVKQGTGWVMELGEEGKSGERIRTIKVGGTGEGNKRGIAIIGVYGPQRKNSAELEEFYQTLGKEVETLREKQGGEKTSNWGREHRKKTGRWRCYLDQSTNWRRRKKRQCAEKGW